MLRCFSCRSFQVQQVKKANRWSCKLCGEKQSLLKEFGRGSGAECRRHVQKLNALRGSMMEEQEYNSWSLWKESEADGENEAEGQRDKQVMPTQVSRWSKYLDTPEEEDEDEEEENVLMDRQLLHENVIDRKRKRREGWTDREAPNRTPGPPNRSSLMAPVRPPAASRAPSDHSTGPPSLSTGPVFKWAGSHKSDAQVKDESFSGGSQSVGGASTRTCNDAIIHNLSLTRPRPLLPISSMFESGEEFSFDDSELLTKL